MNAKIQKLERQFTDETPAQIERQGSSSSIFKGIAIFVNGYTGQSFIRNHFKMSNPRSYIQ